jgi:hypothetical protein
LGIAAEEPGRFRRAGFTSVARHRPSVEGRPRMSETSGTQTSGPVAELTSQVEKGARNFTSSPLSKPAGNSCAAVQFTGTHDR